MKRFLLCVAFLFVCVLAGCDSLKSDDSREDNNGNNENGGETTMVVPAASQYA